MRLSEITAKPTQTLSSGSCSGCAHSVTALENADARLRFLPASAGPRLNQPLPLLLPFTLGSRHVC